MQGSCYKTSNNKYFDCPALMSDGRAFTDYRPSSYVNDLIRVQNNAYNSYDYRQFLIHHAGDLMKAEQMYLEQTMGVNIPGPAIPGIQTECVYDSHSGLCYSGDQSGIGVSNKASSNNPMPSLPYRPFA